MKRHFFVLWIALMLSGVLVGAMVHGSFRAHHLGTVREDVRIVAEVNAHGLAHWIEQRMADARMMSENTGYTRRVELFFDDPDDEVNTSAVIERLLGEHRYHRFSRLRLFDPDGVERLAVPSRRDSDVPDTADIMRAFSLPGRIDFGEAFVASEGSVEVPIVVPLSVGEAEGERVPAVCVFHVDLTRYVFPLLEQWPGSSESGEMLLVRPGDSGYEILNPRRDEQAGAETILTVGSLGSRGDEALGAGGMGATMDTVDHRGTQVMSALHRVEGTPWLVLAKLDRHEAYAPVRTHLAFSIAAVALWVAAVTFGVGSLWRSSTEGQRLAEARVAFAESETRALAEANRRLEESDQLKRTFLANVSHELRTPLNSIIGFSGILTQGVAGPLTSEQRMQAAMINSSGRHLLTLIEGVLDLAKIEAGKVEVSVESFDVAMALREVATALRPLSEESGLWLRVEGEERLSLASDEVKVRQVLLNLIGNAVKFTAEGGVDVALSRSPGGGVLVSVRDTGPGIPESQLEHLFDPFFQVERPGEVKPPGTGLGLAISSEYARMLGGELTVRTKVGKGSTFEARFPDMEV